MAYGLKACSCHPLRQKNFPFGGGGGKGIRKFFAYFKWLLSYTERQDFWFLIFSQPSAMQQGWIQDLQKEGAELGGGGCQNWGKFGWYNPKIGRICMI